MSGGKLLENNTLQAATNVNAGLWIKTTILASTIKIAVSRLLAVYTLIHRAKRNARA
jgi:hypothetical protein